MKRQGGDRKSPPSYSLARAGRAVNALAARTAASEFAGQEAPDEGVGRGKRFAVGGGWRLA